MTQFQKMKKALNENVISHLIEQGFEGKYPDYRKIYDDRIELLSFIKNKYGSSFTIEVSTVFLPCRKRNNNFIDSDCPDYENATVSHTNMRYRLKGLYDGWFYYSDLYCRQIGDILDFNAISESKAKSYVPHPDEKLIQEVSDETYQKICEEINQQMKNAFKWWNAFNNNNKIKLWFLNKNN